MNTKITIEELQQTESGALTGGFVALNSPSDSESVINNNCSDASGWYNDNCGCSTCGSNTIQKGREVH